MQWKKDDVELYIQSKEYVDTLLIPLLPVILNENDEQMKIKALQSQILSIFSTEIEKQYKGRIFLSPTYTYQSDINNNELEIDRLNQWVKSAKPQGFKHVFHLTFDPSWKKAEKQLEGSLIWLPMGQVSEIQSNGAQQIIHSQISEIIELIMVYWQDEIE